MTMPIALTIAGSDSGGGAGIQADLKSFQRFGVFGTSVVTAITAQNTRGVTAWQAVSPVLVAQQADAVATDLRPAAVKSGMLGDAVTVGAVADALERHALAPYVLDPVMVATSGDLLLERDAVQAIVARLVPRATLVTPNLDEAAILVGEPVRDVAAMERAGRHLVESLGAAAALVKGGHLTGDTTTDVLVDAAGVLHVTHARIATTSLHGTGCTLSAAITANLALGLALRDAVHIALDYVHRAIASAPGLGSGHGPLEHRA
ncbi:MAG: bifunctional hydroxymethylpyrimidine kinase/phosphomethylpyrimidine kinase [Gemmatimonadaceae bacterium]|jgi:hydroxymethylpyrimidine/phosphomethylpyrimidine kinase|nr:bifunctional hydroxymethylpyrimidine kinase/phosphomethylpyrimidine kinase [Gemmatimonadaceae bacterium]